MKKHLLLVLIIFANTIVIAQNTPQEKHLHKAFDAIKNNDAEAFKLLWPDHKTFSKIIISSGDFDAETSNNIEVYNESRYYRMIGKMLEEFLEIQATNNEVNWKDLYIKQIYFDKNATKNSDGIIEYSGYIWLKSTIDKTKNYSLTFVDLIEFKKQWYGSLFHDVKIFEGGFDEFIHSQEMDDEVSYAEEAVAEAATEIAMAATDSLATMVDLPVLEQGVFSATINNKKMILNWRVNGWEDDRIYNQITYQYQNREEQSFAEIIELENGYLLLIEEDLKSFFRIKNTYGSLNGTWFSTQTGKEIPLIFASTEVKK